MTIPDNAQLSGVPDRIPGADGLRMNRPAFFSALFLIVLWGRFFWSLVAEWELDPQYAHGWFIPVLCGILAWGRFRSHPQQEANSSPWLAGSILVFLLPLLPLAFLEAVYPEARPFH